MSDNLIQLEDKKEKKIGKGGSPTYRFVRQAFEHNKITITGDGLIYDKDGDFVTHPTDVVKLFHDIHDDKDVNPQYFEAAVETMCNDVKKQSKKKVIDALGNYKFDPRINLRRACQIMLSGLDFESKEGKDRLYKFIWGLESTILQIKRKMHKLPIFDHKMVILVGSFGQGDQKTEFCKRLFEPLNFLQGRVSVKDIADNSRNFTRFVNYYGLLCDELRGASQSDFADIKETITADFLYPRVLGKQKIIKVPNNSTILGTSNFSSCTVFQDPSGSRRFLDLEVTEDKKRDRFEKLKNEIDWLALWQGVKYDYSQEEIRTYLDIRDDLILPYQQENTFRDYIEEFIQENGVKSGKDFITSSWLHQEFILYIEYKQYAGKKATMQVFGIQMKKYGIESIKFRDQRGYYIDKSSFDANCCRIKGQM